MAADTQSNELPQWGRRMGEHLEAARNRAQMSRAELAQRVGVSEESIRRWERGGARPTPERLAHVIAVMAIDAGRLAALSKSGDERPKLARLLLDERSGRRITQAQAARLVGVAQPTYAGWEIGRATPGSVHVPSLGAFLGIPEAQMLELVSLPFRVDSAAWPPLGRVIGAHRQTLRMTRAELARRLNVTVAAVEAWELGYRIPRPSSLRSLAIALKASPEELELALPRPTRPVSPLGLLIHRRQRNLGLRVEDIAERSGLDPGTVSRWISGRHRPSQANLTELARVLDLPTSTVQEAAYASL